MMKIINRLEYPTIVYKQIRKLSYIQVMSIKFVVITVNDITSFS